MRSPSELERVHIPALTIYTRQEFPAAQLQHHCQCLYHSAQKRFYFHSLKVLISEITETLLEQVRLIIVCSLLRQPVSVSTISLLRAECMPPPPFIQERTD